MKKTKQNHFLSQFINKTQLSLKTETIKTKKADIEGHLTDCDRINHKHTKIIPTIPEKKTLQFKFIF